MLGRSPPALIRPRRTRISHCRRLVRSPMVGFGRCNFEVLAGEGAEPSGRGSSPSRSCQELGVPSLPARLFPEGPRRAKIFIPARAPSCVVAQSCQIATLKVVVLVAAVRTFPHLSRPCPSGLKLASCCPGPAISPAGRLNRHFEIGHPLYGSKNQSECARTFVKSTNVRKLGSNVRSWGANVRLFARNVRQTNVRTEPGTERSSDERSFPECERSKPTSPVRTHTLDGRRPGRTFGPRDERSSNERSSARTFEPRNERSHSADERS